MLASIKGTSLSMPCPLHLFKDTSSFKQNVNILFPSNSKIVLFSLRIESTLWFYLLIAINLLKGM